MRIHTDDELTRIDRTYLGPKGRRLPWLATYRQYGMFFIVSAGLFVILDNLGYPMTRFWWFFYYLVGAVLATRFVSNRMRDDVGLMSNVRTAWQEVDVPRDRTGEARKWDVQIEDIERHAVRHVWPAPTRWDCFAARVCVLFWRVKARFARTDKPQSA